MGMELRARMQHLSKRDRYPFHMPGHKGKFPDLYSQFDPTELPGLDNLHSPEGVLARAQSRVANIYRAKKTYFLVNGSSVGLMAALAAVVTPGELVLVPRSCHKSILAGLIHSGAMPVWIEERLCSSLRHWLPPDREQIQRLLAKYPIRGAVFTNPDYYGLAPDIKGITALCHDNNIPVIVDEAHGAHLFLGVHQGLPLSAVDANADIVVQSPHKTLPALTQAAWLHLNNTALEERVQLTLNLFQTTSPSYLLLSSLEYAGSMVGSCGISLLKRLNYLVKTIELKAFKLELGCWPRQARDWTKFVLADRRGLTQLLHSKGIFPELIQGGKVLFMLTIADARDPRGIVALSRVMPEVARLKSAGKVSPAIPPLPVQACTPREAWIIKGEKILIRKALGRIVRQIIAPYPPGTMVVAPGQRLENEHIEYLLMLQAEKVIPEWIEVI